MEQNDSLIKYGLVVLVLVGLGLASKFLITDRMKTEESSYVQETRKSIPVWVRSVREEQRPRLMAMETGKRQADEVRRTASTIPHEEKSRVTTSETSPTETVADVSGKSAKLFQEPPERQRRLVEFLKLHVGLDEQQIQLVNIKNKIYVREMLQASIMARRGVPKAKQIQRIIVDRHNQWMTYYLGPENYQEYLELAKN